MKHRHIYSKILLLPGFRLGGANGPFFLRELQKYYASQILNKSYLTAPVSKKKKNLLNKVYVMQLIFYATLASPKFDSISSDFKIRKT